MNAIDILQLGDKLEKFDGQQIKDITTVELLNGSASRFYSKDLKNLAFSVGATGTVRAELYNSADDKDRHGVIGDILPIRDDQGYIKYIANGNAKVMGTHNGGNSHFHLVHQRGASYAVYRKHSFSDEIPGAIRDDLRRFATVLDLTDSEEKLAVGEAATLHVNGQLEANVSLSYSDVFLSSLSSLSKLLDKNELIKVQFDPDIVLDFTVGIEDTFTVVFHRNHEQQYTVLVKKADVRQWGGSLKAGIRVSFTNPDQVGQVLNDLLEQLLQTPEDKIREMLSKNRVTDLARSQRKLLEKLLDRLGLEQAPDKLEALRHRYQELKDDVSRTITREAKQSVELGFSYEYQRISTRSTLFKGKFDKAALDKYHFDLLSGNLKRVVESQRNGGADHIEIEHYLQESQQKRRKAWGFSLGFASLARKEDIDMIERENEDGHYQVAFSGYRRYEDKFFGNTTAWEVDFKTEMPVFSAHPTPLASEFDYSLYLSLEWKDRRLRKKEDLLEYLDQGVLWRAIPPGEMTRIADELYPMMKRDTLTVTSQLKVSAYAFRQLLTRMIVLNERNDILGQALGAAMPYELDHEIKRSVELRSKYYGQVWHHYLENPVPGNEDFYLTFAYQTLKPISPELARRERILSKDRREETVRLNHRTDDRLNRFKKGIHRLHTGIQHPTPYTEVIRPAYRDIQAFWSLPFYTRALGYYLLHLSSDRPDIMGEIERIFTISYQNADGQEEIINLTTHL